MSYNNQNTGSYESRMMKEIMVIISVVIIGISILCWYINRNFGSDENDSVYDDTVAEMLKNDTYISSKTDSSWTDTSNPTPNVGQVINVDKIEPSTLEIDPLTRKNTAVDSANIVYYYGNMAEDEQEDLYSFVATYDGEYRIDLTGMQSDTIVRLYLYDELGEVLSSDTYCVNEEGITGMGLEAGKQYFIKIKQHDGYTAYTLSIGMQKPPMNLTGFTEITDSIEFIDQRNIYYFSVPVSGRYRFELTDVYSGTVFDLRVFDSLGEMMDSDTYCINEEGITVRDLKAGEIYEIQVRQNKGFSTYKLDIGYQKDTVDISEYTIVKDSVEYEEQCNVYTFTAPIDGVYRFELSGMNGDTDMKLYMVNQLEEIVESDTYCMNGEGITVVDLKAGEIYEVQVHQNNGCSSYTLSIGKQKKRASINQMGTIRDSVEYTGQRNVYSLTTQSGGDITVEISVMDDDVYVEVFVFNELKEEIESDTYFENDESITIYNCSVGEQYEIQIRQSRGLSNYTLTINEE